MANKFKVNVTLTARTIYEVEIEANDEDAAEREAFSRWRELAGEDFQVYKPDEYEAETEQLTWECRECSAEISELEFSENDELCNACAKLEDDAI